MQFGEGEITGNEMEAILVSGEVDYLIKAKLTWVKEFQ